MAPAVLSRFNNRRYRGQIVCQTTGSVVIFETYKPEISQIFVFSSGVMLQPEDKSSGNTHRAEQADHFSHKTSTLMSG
jgi:hypothetical protein